MQMDDFFSIAAGAHASLPVDSAAVPRQADERLRSVNSAMELQTYQCSKLHDPDPPKKGR